MKRFISDESKCASQFSNLSLAEFRLYCLLQCFFRVLGTDLLLGPSSVTGDDYACKRDYCVHPRRDGSLQQVLPQSECCYRQSAR